MHFFFLIDLLLCQSALVQEHEADAITWHFSDGALHPYNTSNKSSIRQSSTVTIFPGNSKESADAAF
jgi:hypothetical protein